MNKNEKFYFNGLETKRILISPNYSASKCGKIFRISTGKQMKLSPHGKSGYLAFRACHENKPSNQFVHVAVAYAWLVNDDPVNKTEVNHRDGNKINNHVDNLEHVTRSQNQRHALETGLKSKGGDLYNASLTDSQVHLICKELEEGSQVKYLSDKYGVSKDVIRKIKSGDTYFHIRVYYNVPHDYQYSLAENTIRWVCELINKGMSDRQISKLSDNKGVTPIECKRIRHKIRYKTITDEYF